MTCIATRAGARRSEFGGKERFTGPTPKIVSHRQKADHGGPLFYVPKNWIVCPFLPITPKNQLRHGYQKISASNTARDTYDLLSLLLCWLLSNAGTAARHDRRQRSGIAVAAFLGRDVRLRSSHSSLT